MCIQNTLQQHILDITSDGKDVADFFYAAMHGLNPNAKFHHQMEAAKHLSKLGLDTALSLTTAEDPASANADVSQSPLSPRERVRVRAKDPSPSTEEGQDGGEQGTNPLHPVHPVNSAPVTDLDIINYKVARLIREETNDGYIIAEFLSRVMHGAAGQGKPISEADRMAAARELMNRGLGRFGDKPDRRISNTQEDRELIHSGLARYIRERTDGGLEPAYFLLEVASGRDEVFTMHQRVTAARELIRRGWDTNYDRIKPEDIAAYYERQEAREPTGYDNRLQEWREKERAAQESQDGSHEDEPQLEAGLFAHLSFDEIDRYEAMSAEEQAEFVEQQRQYRASHQSAAAQHNTPSPSTGAQKPPLPQGEGWGEGIQKPPSPLTAEGRDGGEDSIRPEPRPELAEGPVEPPAASPVRPEPVEGLVEGHAQQNTHSPSTEAQKPPLPQGEGWGEGIQKPPSPLTGEGRDGGEDSIAPEPRPELAEGPVEPPAASPVRPEPVEGLVEGHAQQNTPSPSTGAQKPPLPQGEGWGEGIQKPPSPLTGEGRDGGENPVRPEPRPEHSRSDEGEDPETTYWNTPLQDDALSKSTPHPVRSATQTHIRSP